MRSRYERFTLSRRTLLGSAAALGSAAVLSSCGSPSGADSARRLTFWNLFTGGDGDNMKRMLSAYRAAHPDVQVEDVTLEWGDRYYTKLAMASAAGRAPDVGVLHLGRIPAFAPGGLIDPLRMDLLREVGLDSRDFPETLWQRSQHNGQPFALPLDTHPFVMYYNVDLCREAGQLDEQGRLRTVNGPEELRSMLRAVKRVSDSYAVVVESAGPEPVSPWRLFWTLYRQAGGEMFSPDGTRLVLDDGKTERILTYLRELADEGLMSTGLPGDGVVAQFSSETSAFMWHGAWEVTTFQTSGTPFSMTRFPAVFGSGVAEADSHAFVLPRRDRTDEEHMLAYRFIAELLRGSRVWAEGGHIPAYLPITEDPSYSRMRPQYWYRSVIDDVELDPPVWFAGSASRLWTDLSPVLAAVMNGRLSVRKGIPEIRQVLQRLLDTPNPNS